MGAESLPLGRGRNKKGERNGFWVRGDSQSCGYVAVGSYLRTEGIWCVCRNLKKIEGEVYDKSVKNWGRAWHSLAMIFCLTLFWKILSYSLEILMNRMRTTFLKTLVCSFLISSTLAHVFYLMQIPFWLMLILLFSHCRTTFLSGLFWGWICFSSRIKSREL